MAAQQSTAVAPLVFDGVTVIDVGAGKLLPAQRVVVAGNHIQAVGGAVAVSVPAGARVVKARGKFLIPGLWDVATNPDSLVSLFYPLLLAHGVTGVGITPSWVRDSQGVARHWRPSLDSLLRWRQEILAGTRGGPPRQLLPGRRDNDENREIAQKSMDLVKAAGANFIWTGQFNYSLAAVARQARLPIGGSTNLLISVFDASDSGLNLAFGVFGPAGGLDSLCLDRNPAAGKKASAERCKALAERFRRNNTWWTPGIASANTPTWANPMFGASKLTLAILKHFDERTKQFWADSPSPAQAASRQAAGTRRVVTPQAPAPALAANPLGALRLAHRAGLPIVAGTQRAPGSLRSFLPGASLHAELAIYVAEGLAPLEALQTATLNPAKLLHATDSLGTIAPGKLADLVLLDANPLADIANTMAIRAVVANGRYFDRAALDQLLTEAKAQKDRLPSEP